jgi:L-lactate dehydrogenase complex protein LldG
VADLWERFEEKLHALGGKVMSVESLGQFRDNAVFDEDLPEAVREVLGSPAADVWEAAAGVTLGDLAVAETGSVLLAALSGRSRLNSLAPPTHVVLVRQADIVASLDEALARLSPQTSVLVTGPSRTADVEGVMVMGVHGPRSLWVVPIP